jgi:hypothetical protein
MEAAHPDATAALGEPLRSGNLRARGMLWLAIPACVVTCFLVVFFGPLWFLPVFALIGGIAYAIVWMHRVSGVVSVHPDGLALRRGWRFLPYFGRRVELYRWDEVVAVYRRLTNYYAEDRHDHSYGELTFRYELVTREGRRTVLDSRFGDIMEVGDIALREVGRRLLPGLLAGYDRGERVSFGPLALSRGGLTCGQQLHDWSAVVGIGVKRGILAVEYQGSKQPWRVPLAAFPNVDLFFALLAQRQPDVWVAANPAHFAEQKRLGPRAW